MEFFRDINFFKLKYADLRRSGIGTLVNDFKYVNLYINLECVLKEISKSSQRENFSGLTKIERNACTRQLISGIVNLAAHYRRFFTSCKIPSNIFFYYGSLDNNDDYNNKIYIPNYRSKYVERYSLNNQNDGFDNISRIIRVALDFLSGLIKYIDACYLIQSNKLEPSVVPLMISRTKGYDQGLNIMLTTDSYDFQYVIHKFLILYPAAKEYEYKFLTRRNIMEYIILKNNISKANMIISYRLLPLMHTFIGDKSRSVPKISGLVMRRLYAQFEKLYQKDYVDNSNPLSFDIENIAEYFAENKFYSISNDTIRSWVGTNYFTVDIEKQLGLCNPVIINDILETFEDIYDPEGLKELNDKFFDSSPLQIVELNNYDPIRRVLNDENVSFD